MSRAFAALLALSLLGGNLWAGEQGRRRGGHRSDEAFKMVVAYLLSNMQESLELNDEEYLELLPRVKLRQNHRRDFHEGRAKAMRQLRRLVSSGGDEASITAALAELDTLETTGPARLAADLEAIDAALTPLQRAKYRLMEADVERRVRDLARRIGRERGPRREPRRDQGERP